MAPATKKRRHVVAIAFAHYMNEAYDSPGDEETEWDMRYRVAQMFTKVPAKKKRTVRGHPECAHFAHANFTVRAMAKGEMINLPRALSATETPASRQSRKRGADAKRRTDSKVEIF